ncbi:MAG: T9SS type A sorting domain-containing protein [Muribaculaceae bacterium]|nr:T9SS type A sorting domain-containing protein [Muribaculaceae bacterium]
MKRVLYIAICLLAMGGVQVLPMPDNFLPQRVETATTGPAALGAEGRIVFVAGNSDAAFNVYSITGQLVKVVRVSADQRVSVDFPKGFYIVRCSNQWSRKVVVR